VTSGAKQAIYNALLATINPGDQVIIPTPYWASYPEMVKLCNAKPVFVNTNKDFRICLDSLSKAINKSTKAIILNSPNNPTGAVYPKKALQEIAKLATENKLWLISDEVYEKIIFDEEHVSIASLGKDVKEQTITINGVSKSYSMTGYRIGYAAGPEQVIKAMQRVQSHTTSNAPSISQWAALEALRGPQESVQNMTKEFKKRRDVMFNELNTIKGFETVLPKGSFYMFPNIKKLLGKPNGSNSMTFCELLLIKAKVATVPGIAFGTDKHVRLSFAVSEQKILEATKRIKKVLE
jgi:aspartate aminotransferase